MRRYTVGTRNYDGYVEYCVRDGVSIVAVFTLRLDAVALADRLEMASTTGVERGWGA